MVTPNKIEPAGADDAAQPTEQPIFLICTVGGSPLPIAAALRQFRPDVVLFLVSDGKTGTSSRSQVENLGPGLKFADGRPANAKILELPADDPDGAYKLCSLHLSEARGRNAQHRLIADYAGGHQEYDRRAADGCVCCTRHRGSVHGRRASRSRPGGIRERTAASHVCRLHHGGAGFRCLKS